MESKEAEKSTYTKFQYDELSREVLSLNDKIFKLEKENKALRYSLTKMYIELESSQSREAMWEEDYYKEHNRAEKLFEELDQLTKKEMLK